MRRTTHVGVPSARVVRVPGGRQVAYRTYGDPVDPPLFYLHGVGGSSVAPHLHVWAAELGLSIAAPDRPGYGQSSPWRRRRIVDVADDLEAIADQLGWRRFAVVGVSGGGPDALATTWAHPHPITRALVASGVGPPASPGSGFHPDRDPKPADIAAVGYHRTLLRVLPLQIGTVLRAPNADRVVAAMADSSDLPLADREAIAHPDVAAAIAGPLAANRLRDARGLAAEMQLLVRDWGFPLREIRVPVDIWIGSDDRSVSVDASGWMAARIPGATHTAVARAGHTLPLTHWRQFLTPVARGVS